MDLLYQLLTEICLLVLKMFSMMVLGILGKKSDMDKKSHFYPNHINTYEFVVKGNF
jgi:hypothetical protein